MNFKLVNWFKGIFFKLCRLKDGILIVDGWFNEIELDSEDVSFLEVMGLDGGKGKGKKGYVFEIIWLKWSKSRFYSEIYYVFMYWLSYINGLLLCVVNWVKCEREEIVDEVVSL